MYVIQLAKYTVYVTAIGISSEAKESSSSMLLFMEILLLPAILNMFDQSLKKGGFSNIKTIQV